MVDGLRSTLLRESEQEQQERQQIATDNHIAPHGDIFAHGFSRESVVQCAQFFTGYATKKYSDQLIESIEYIVTLLSDGGSTDGVSMYEVRRNQTQPYTRVARVETEAGVIIRISVDCQETHTSGT